MRIFSSFSSLVPVKISCIRVSIIFQMYKAYENPCTWRLRWPVSMETHRNLHGRRFPFSPSERMIFPPTKGWFLSVRKRRPWSYSIDKIHPLGQGVVYTHHCVFVKILKLSIYGFKPSFGSWVDHVRNQNVRFSVSFHCTEEVPGCR